MTKLTDLQIVYLVRQAQGLREYPKETLGQMAGRWGVTPRRLRQLLQHWRTTGSVPRLNPNRRPLGPPLTLEQKAQIEAEWQRAPRGATKIFKALKRQGIKIPKMRVYRFLKMQGKVLSNPRKQRKRSRCRYEREHTGSLVHGDFHRTSLDHPYVIVWEDDASRMVLAGGEFPERSTEHAIETFREAQAKAREWNLEIREANTDRGVEFLYSPKRDGREVGETAFQTYLKEQGIRHVVSRVNNPQTNGKVERWWYEYDKHRWRYRTLQEFLDWYNDQIHDALQELETPREAFQRKLPEEVLLGLHTRLVEATA